MVSEKELDILAEKIAEKLIEKHGECSLTSAEQDEIRSILKMKKKAVRKTLFLLGAVLLWIFRDIYEWGKMVFEHMKLTFN